MLMCECRFVNIKDYGNKNEKDFLVSKYLSLFTKIVVGTLILCNFEFDGKLLHLNELLSVIICNFIHLKRFTISQAKK